MVQKCPNKDLIAEIEAQGSQAVQTVNGGNKRGTYVCKELVIAYGMWINADFALKVIRCFLEQQNPSAATLTAAQKQQIQKAVQERHHRTGEHWQEIYRKLHNLLRVNSYHEIQASDFQTALNYLASMENAPSAVTAPSVKAQDQDGIPGEMIMQVGHLLLHAQTMRQWVSRYLSAFESLGIDQKGFLWSYVHDTEGTFEAVRNRFTKQCPPLGQEHWLDSRLTVLHRRILNTASI